MNAEQKLVQVLKANEHIIHIIPADELKNEWELKKAKIKSGSNYIAPLLDSIVAIKLLRDFGISTNKVVIKNYAGKQYVIFKGYPGVRKIFRGTRYLTNNPTIVRMAVGPKGIKSTVKGGFIITVALSAGIELFDYFIRDTATLSHLLGTITGDIIKIGVGAIAAAVAGLTVGSAVIIGSVAAVPIIAAIAVGLFTGYVLDEIDTRTGATAALIKGYEKLGLKLKEIEYEAARWHYYFDHHPSEIMRLFGARGAYGGY